MPSLADVVPLNAHIKASYDGDIPGNAIMDWVNFIQFGGHEYLSKAMRGEGDEVDESRLGEVL